MGYYVSVPFLALAVVLQSSVLPYWRWYAGQPDLILLLVLCWAVHAQWQEALFWAVLGGLLQDVVGLTPLGTSVIGLVLLVFAIQSISTNVYRFSVLLLVVAVVVGTFLQHGILYAVLGITQTPVNILESLRYFTLPTLSYNLLLLLPLYWLLRRIQKRLPRPQSAWDVNPR